MAWNMRRNNRWMGINSIGHESYFVYSSVFKSSQLTNIPNGIYLLDMMNLKTFRWADTIWPQQRIERCYLICFSFSRLSLSIYLPQPYLSHSSLFLSYLFALLSGCTTTSMSYGIAEKQIMIPSKLVPISVKYGFGQCTHTHIHKALTPDWYFIFWTKPIEIRRKSLSIHDIQFNVRFLLLWFCLLFRYFPLSQSSPYDGNTNRQQQKEGKREREWGWVPASLLGRKREKESFELVERKQ